MSVRILSTESDGSAFGKLARSTATNLWGSPLQTRRTIVTGKAWAFTTPGHGGVVVALTDAELAAFPAGTWRHGAEVYAAFRGHHLVAFEEDIDWCLPVLFLRDFATAYAKRGGWSEPLTAERVSAIAAGVFSRWADNGYYGRAVS